jgi:hypothetical protein
MRGPVTELSHQRPVIKPITESTDQVIRYIRLNIPYQPLPNQHSLHTALIAASILAVVLKSDIVEY